MRAYSRMTTRTRWGRAALWPPKAGCRELSAGARLEGLIAGCAACCQRRCLRARFRVVITTRVFMSKVRDVIGRQKDHDRMRHLKAASGACPLYGLPDPVALIVVLHSIG